jgi:hypothetical protein
LSRVISIFVDLPDSGESLVSRLEPVLSLKFRNSTQDDAEAWEGRTPDSIVTVMRHDFENDRDLHFEDYPYEIQFRAIRDQKYDMHERKTWAHAKSVFDGLQSVLNCPMMLVDDLQHKLEEYKPSPVT